MKKWNYVSVHLYENAINQLNWFDILCAKLTKENQLLANYVSDLEKIINKKLYFNRHNINSYQNLLKFYKNFD